MAYVKEVKSYETTDGQVFKFKKDAESCQAKIDLEDEYLNSKLYSGGGQTVDLEDILDWAEENKTMLRNICKAAGITVK